MANPVVKWAGGKRQLLPTLKSLLPSEFNRYFEPFFGGGALFFDIKPQNAIINDFNAQLVNVYRQLRDNKDSVVSRLSALQNKYNKLNTDREKTDFFLEKRKQFNDVMTSGFTDVSAALFIFLNKAGFNGLYRVNSKGKLNVPSAHRDKLSTFDQDNINEVSNLLQSCEIMLGDFEDACKEAKKGDLVFFDSPYYETFDTYQAGGFNERDHIRLFNLFKRLSDMGVYCILTNNNCDFIKNLYSNYNIQIVSVKRLINCDSRKRSGSEVIITNF